MSIIDQMKKLWKAATQRENTSKPDFWLWKLTPLRLEMYRLLRKIIPQAISGKVLDVGAGTLLYKKELVPYSETYVATDKYSDHKDLGHHDDIKHLSFKDETFDSVFCNQVLEHVDDPIQALKEVNRVMKKEALLLLGTPFYFYIHGLPHDYFRYTEQGLRKILKQTGFDIKQIHSAGGYFSAVFEPLNIAFISLGFNIPLWQHCIKTLNFLAFVVPPWILDHTIGLRSYYPGTYFVVAQKKR